MLECFGGDECDADSLSLLIHMHIHRHTSMHFCLFAFLSIPDSWWPSSDSLSFLIQSYTPTCILVCLCVYIGSYICIPYSWLPNSLFLLDTGYFICPTTSCRPCHGTFSPGFQSFSEYAFLSWLITGDTLLECTC